MPAPEITDRPAAPARTPPAFGPFPTALRFAARNQARNRLAGLLLVAFVPIWYLLMFAMAGHQTLSFRLYSTGPTLSVDGGRLTLTLISAGLNALTMIVGFAVFDAIRKALPFERLVFAGYRQATLIAAKVVATAVVAAVVAAYTAVVLLAFWRPGLLAWTAIVFSFTPWHSRTDRWGFSWASWSSAISKVSSSSSWAR